MRRAKDCGPSRGGTLASAVAQGFLLDAATHLTLGVAGERDDVESLEDAGGVLGIVQAIALLLPPPPWRGSSVVIWILVRNCSPCSARLFLYTVPNLPGTRSTQAGRGVILPSGQGHDAGEFTRVPAASVLAVPHVLINP